MEIDIQLLLAGITGAGCGILLGAVCGWWLGQRRGTRLKDELLETRTRCDHREQQLAELKHNFDTLAENHQALQRESAALQTRLDERDQQYRQQLALLNDNREALKKEFELLANRIFEDKGRHFTATSRESLEALLKPFREQIAGFQTRVNEVHLESVRGNTALGAEIKKVLEIGLVMNEQADSLARALKGDKKTAGSWGEAQLERTLQLAGLVAGEHYESQAAFKDQSGKRKLPDFVLKLPDGKHLVIDSKVSLVDYDRAITAETDEQRAEALAAHARAVRNHIDDLAGKDYSNLPEIGSPDFVLMFMPVEPAYIEALKDNRDLFNYGYQKGVVMVSHTTLMPILRTVANLWMVERSNKEAREISDQAGELYNQVCTVAERLYKLGNTLATATRQYNDTVTGLVGRQGLHGKVERFQQVSTRANKSLPPIEPIHTDIDLDRLQQLRTEDEPAEIPAVIDERPDPT